MSPAKMSKIESAVRTAIDFITAMNNKDAANACRLISTDCIIEDEHASVRSDHLSGKKKIEEFIQRRIAELENRKIEIEEIIGLGMNCVVRWYVKTIKEENEQEINRGVDIFKIRNGLIYEIEKYAKIKR